MKNIFDEMILALVPTKRLELARDLLAIKNAFTPAVVNMALATIFCDERRKTMSNKEAIAATMERFQIVEAVIEHAAILRKRTKVNACRRELLRLRETWGILPHETWGDSADTFDPT